MKLRNLLVLLAVITFTFSCGDDDDASNDNTDINVAGTYDVINIYGQAEERDSEDGTLEINTSTITTSDYDNLTITFSEINETTRRGTITSTGTFLLTETIVEDGETDVDRFQEFLEFTGTYTVNGEDIIISGEGEVDVENVTATGFDIIVSENEVEPDYTYQVEFTIELSKQ